MLSTRHAGRVSIAELGVELSSFVYLWPTRRSYTGQPLVELHLPGSQMLVDAVLAALFRTGVRPAQPGEFTLRAFLAGRLDLAQAEAVLGVIDAADHSELNLALRQLAGGLSGRLADVRADLLSLLADLEAGLDFVDEDIEFVSRDEVVTRVETARQAIVRLLEDATGRWRDSDRLRVVLAGLPNAGKSTLFNAIIGGDRALVSPIAGTTRDWLAAEIRFSGLDLELIDTAGWEESDDDLSRAMQSLRAEQLDRADLILWCIAANASPEELRLDALLREQIGSVIGRTLVIATKSDLSSNGNQQIVSQSSVESRLSLAVSAVTGLGLDELRSRIAAKLASERSGARQMIGSTAARGRESLARAADALERSLEAARLGFGDEVISAELRLALDGLAAVVGAIYTDDVLDVIFSRFCIGK